MTALAAREDEGAEDERDGFVDLVDEDREELEELIATEYGGRFPRGRVDRVEILTYGGGKSREFVMGYVFARDRFNGKDSSALVAAWIDEAERVHLTRFNRHEVESLRQSIAHMDTLRGGAATPPSAKPAKRRREKR